METVRGTVTSSLVTEVGAVAGILGSSSSSNSSSRYSRAAKGGVCVVRSVKTEMVNYFVL